MTRTSRTAVSLVALLAANNVAAVPPPMAAEELVVKSDVVATVRVLAVACIGYRPFGSVPSVRPDTPYYHAWLQVIDARKGPYVPGETLVVEWQEVPFGLIGPVAVPYLPGEEVSTHLAWNGRAYTTTWWNGKGEPSKRSRYRELARAPGALMLPEDRDEPPAVR